MKTKHRIPMILSILLLVSLACVLPFSGNQTPTPTTLPTETAHPSGGDKLLQQPDLPPVLIETDPVAGSEIAPAGGLTLFFNQSMDHPTVEAALQGHPALAGRYEWLDDSTVRFIPDPPFPAGAELTLTLSAGALAANGQALPEPVELRFQVADSLRVAERLPKPGVSDANPSGAVVVTFNRPVTALGADPAGQSPAFTLQPEAKGRGEWLNTSTYIFYPEPALAGGVAYTVTLDPALVSAGGVPLSLEGLEPQEWSFTTALPAVTNLTFGEFERLELDGKSTMTFNQPMDTASVEQNLTLVSPAGAATPLKFTWDERGTQVVFQPVELLQRGAAYTIRLKSQAHSLGGAAMGAEYTYVQTSVPALAVASTSPGPGEMINANYGQGFYSIDLTAPLDRQDFSSLVTVDPPLNSLNIGPTYDRYGITIDAAFQPATTYRITLAAGLRDRWGGTLGAPVTLEVRTETPPPSLVIPIAQVGAPAIFVPTGQTALDVRVTNLASVQVERRALSLDEFIMSVGASGAAPEGSSVKRWTQAFESTVNRSVRANMRLDAAGGALSPGVYWLTVNAPGLGENSNPAYLLVASDIHLTLKLSPRQAVVWAVDLTTQAPSAGLPVRIMGFGVPDQGNCITDKDGLCTIDLPERKNVYDTLLAVAGQPGDTNFGLVASTMNQGLSPWELGVPYESDPLRQMVYLYTDRPIYRPGQTVHFKAVLRAKDNGRYSPLDLSDLKVQILPPYDVTLAEQKPLTELSLAVTGYGSASGDFDLPANAQPGYYSINLPDQNASVSFQVAEYRKPEFDLQAAFEKPAYQIGDSFKASVTAAYYFGAPVSDLPVNWTLFSRSDWVYLPDNLQAGVFDDSWLYPYDRFTSSLGDYVVQGQGQTGADGKLVVEIPASALDALKITNRRSLVLEVNASDESNQMISVRAEAALHPSSFYIGVRPDVWSAQAGEELGYTIQAVDWADSPAGEHTLKAVFSRVEWVRQSDLDSVYGYPSYTKTVTEIGSTDLRTDALGRARAAFTPADAGTYQLEVSGEGALTQVLSWVAGPAIAPWPSLPNQRLRLEADAAEYKPGQTATIRIANPYEGSALALISVERSKVMRTYVQTIEGSIEEFKLPLDAIDAPNVFVSVLLIGKKSGGLNDFRQGIVGLVVKPDAFKLSVEASFDPTQAGPGDEVKLNLLVKGPDGKPVQGEFSLALVDKAALALADPNSLGIFQAFYGQQYLAVQTSLNLTAASSRLVAMQLGRGGGGGGEAMATAPGERTQFKDTAGWYPVIETDAQGKAELTMRLPDNLTTWVADLRGLTADMKVGEGRAEIIATKPLLVRPVTPRFLVVGDHLQLGAIVQNNTDAPISVDVSLEAPGLTLDDPASASQAVEVPAGGRVRVDWGATVQDVPSVDPVFAARGGGLEDVTHTERGALPVVRYTATQTYATAGVLQDAGTRLEVVSLPRTFTPTGGELRVELSPSLAATVLQGLKALEAFPDDFTEPVISRLLANAAAYRALKDFNLQAPDLQSSLESSIRADLRRLLELQSYDGGWNWNRNYNESDLRLTAYALLGLSQAAQADFFVNADAVSRAQDFLTNGLVQPSAEMDQALLERQALMFFSLQESGKTGLNPGQLYSLREKLSPSGKALLALALEGAQPGDERARALVSDLAALADRSATGASWQSGATDWASWSTPVFTTAVASFALARIDPASTLMTDSLRYLVLHRRPTGCWGSSYESAWVLLALSQALKSTGDLQANFTYQASLNDTLLANGQAEGASGALTPVTASAPLSQLLPDAPNALKIQREAGDGRLYYRAYLEVGRPAGDAPAVSRGVFIQREYFTGGQDCRAVECRPVTQAELGSSDGFVVRLTVTLPKDMYYLVVEDAIPSGAEIINPNLKTSRQGYVGGDTPEGPQYDLADPFRGGWGWWFFGAAKIYDDHIRWIAPFLPAGTYTLTYRLSAALAGDFQVIPAHAYQYYFPEVEGSSAGSVLIIK
jgi:uncharacterized protein YfaS (alpha-2-macroglobulin family)